MANDLTRDFFQNLATTVSPDTHDDILKIGNVFTGSKYLATTTANFAKMHRRKLAAEIKAVNVDMDVDACIEMMETALKCKFPDPEATPMTAAMRGARRQRGVRAGHARLPRFIPRGMAFETLGEKLARLGQLDTLTLPRTFGNYVRMVNSKMTKKHVRRITRDVFVFTLAKFGSVNPDALYYGKIQSLLEVKFGSSVLPSHGRVDGDDRRWADLLRHRFCNGRRTNAPIIYAHVPVVGDDLCSDGEELVEQGLHVVVHGADNAMDVDCDDAANGVGAADANADEAAARNAAFTLKTFNPQCDARRTLRNVYVGDPVLDLIEEDLDLDGRKARIVKGQWLLLPTSFFEYLDTTAMPLYVAAEIGDEVPSRSADKPSRYVFMIGDGKPKIKVNYYIEAHPVPYTGEEAHLNERYLTNPVIKFLSGAPPTM